MNRNRTRRKLLRESRLRRLARRQGIHNSVGNKQRSRSGRQTSLSVHISVPRGDRDLFILRLFLWATRRLVWHRDWLADGRLLADRTTGLQY